MPLYFNHLVSICYCLDICSTILLWDKEFYYTELNLTSTTYPQVLSKALCFQEICLIEIRWNLIQKCAVQLNETLYWFKVVNKVRANYQTLCLGLVIQLIRKSLLPLFWWLIQNQLYQLQIKCTYNTASDYITDKLNEQSIQKIPWKIHTNISGRHVRTVKVTWVGWSALFRKSHKTFETITMCSLPRII